MKDDVQKMLMYKSVQYAYVIFTPPKCDYVSKWSDEEVSTGSMITAAEVSPKFTIILPVS